MTWQVRLKKTFAWLVSVFMLVGGFLFAESWLIASPKILGLPGAILVVGLITTCFAWITTYAISGNRVNEKILSWAVKKEEEASVKIQRYLKWGKIVAIVAADLSLGPEFVPFFLFALGIKGKQAYLYSAACGFLFSSVWCSIYAGVWWWLAKTFNALFR